MHDFEPSHLGRSSLFAGSAGSAGTGHSPFPTHRCSLASYHPMRTVNLSEKRAGLNRFANHGVTSARKGTLVRIRPLEYSSFASDPHLLKCQLDSRYDTLRPEVVPGAKHASFKIQRWLAQRTDQGAFAVFVTICHLIVRYFSSDPDNPRLLGAMARLPWPSFLLRYPPLTSNSTLLAYILMLNICSTYAL